MTLHCMFADFVIFVLDLNNIFPESGASMQMTSLYTDLFDFREGLKVSVQVDYRHIIHCTSMGKIWIEVANDYDDPFIAELHG
jgi:hypothetical protein